MKMPNEHELGNFLRDFAIELYFRAQNAKDRNERMAIKGVQHALERAMATNKIETFDRQIEIGKQK